VKEARKKRVYVVYLYFFKKFWKNTRLIYSDKKKIEQYLPEGGGAGGRHHSEAKENF
jgi:hypothetical protein